MNTLRICDIKCNDDWNFSFCAFTRNEYLQNFHSTVRNDKNSSLYLFCRMSKCVTMKFFLFLFDTVHNIFSRFFSCWMLKLKSSMYIHILLFLSYSWNEKLLVAVASLCMYVHLKVVETVNLFALYLEHHCNFSFCYIIKLQYVWIMCMTYTYRGLSLVG